MFVGTRSYVVLHAGQSSLFIFYRHANDTDSEQSGEEVNECMRTHGYSSVTRSGGERLSALVRMLYCMQDKVVFLYSLKSNLFIIDITSILSRMKVNHPVTRLPVAEVLLF